MSTLDLGKIKQLWRGTWSSSASYLPNDIVSYNGAIWICTQSQGTGSSTEFSPGKRDRANVLGKTVDHAEVDTFNITVQTVNSANYFFIDGRQAPSFTIYPNVHYKFYQKDATNTGHRFALSTTADGVYGSGGVELSINSANYIYQYTGTPGIDYTLDVVLPSSVVGSLYYYSATDTGYGGAALTPRTVLTVAAAWRGYQYWDQLTTGYRFQGAYSAVQQYYYNDIVEFQGTTYLSLADNLGKFPGEPMNNHVWLILVVGDRRSEHNSAGWFMNKGPVDWPYPHGNQGNGNQLASHKWISRSGRVYNHGGGYSYNGGLHRADTDLATTFAQEIVFNHHDWWMSRDNSGPGRLVTPDGQPPRCVQIEGGWSWAHYLFNNGEVHGHGFNATGYLGTGDINAIGSPRRVGGLNDVKVVKISAGYGPLLDNHHVLALDEYGYVWSWGDNANGQLGLGHTNNVYDATRIPRGYFNNERVVDIIAMGSDQGWSYARTQQGSIYAWGYNGSYQLGTTDTTNRYRPTLMQNWTASANGGLVKWQAVGWGSSYSSLMLLDGNGYLWHTGYDQWGAAGFASIASSGTTPAYCRTSLTKSTATPGGSIVSFWALWSGETSNYYQTFIRTNTGTTYTCGNGSAGNNNISGNAAIAGTTIIGPTALTTTIGTKQGIVNIKDVFMHISRTDAYYRNVTWLLDSGQVYSQGCNTYGEMGNPQISQNAGNNLDETGSTYLPVAIYYPPSTKVVQIMPGGSGATSTGSYQHGMFFMMDNGQVFACGEGRSNGQLRGSAGSFIGYTPMAGEGAAVGMLVSIQYAR